MPSPKRLLLLLLPAVALAGCKHDSEITAIGNSLGQEISRTGCPALAIPAATGDITLFNPPASREARAIDVVAAVTDLHGQCDQTDPNALHSTATFQVQARRSSAQGPRDVVLPYFAVVMRAGDQVVSKSLSQVLVHFDDGKLTATATGQATASVNRADATLPESVLNKIDQRKRKERDAVDQSVDPLSDPTVRAAITKASFELLVGFQLTREQLAYNATR